MTVKPFVREHGVANGVMLLMYRIRMARAVELDDETAGKADEI